jgi:hypothetical protein
LVEIGICRSRILEAELSRTDKRWAFLSTDIKNSLGLILLCSTADRQASNSAAVGNEYETIPECCRLPNFMVKTQTLWFGGFVEAPDATKKNYPPGTAFPMKTSVNSLVVLPRFNAFAGMTLDLSKVQDEKKDLFLPEHRSSKVNVTFVNGILSGKQFIFDLEVTDKSLLVNKEVSTVVQVPESSIVSAVRLGDRFYDTHQKDGNLPTGVVVSFPSENLVGVIFDMGTIFAI